MSARVEIRGLSRSFSGRSALRDVSLTLEAGTTTTLVGASGSGKSTLLRCLAGLLAPDAGEILFDGRDVTGVPAERRGVGFVFQSYALFPHLTVARNLSFGLDVRGVSESERSRRVSELAAVLGLSSLLDRRPGQISGGERQRVALGRALAYRPVLLLLDEPLAALDPNLADSVREALARAIAAERTTVLIVTHDRSDALRLGDRVALLREGVLEQTGTPRDLYRNPATEYAANFFGAGAVWNAVAVREGGCSWAETPLGRVRLPRDVSGPVRIVARPEAVLESPDGISLPVRRVSYEGDRYRLTLEAGPEGSGTEACLDVPAGGEAPPRTVRVRLDPDLLVVLGGLAGGDKKGA